MGTLVLTGSVQAACVPGNSGPIKPSADTYANQNEPGVAYGSGYGWDAANATAGFAGLTEGQTMHGYVKYSLPSIPAGCSLKTATLRIAEVRRYLVKSQFFVPSPIFIQAAAASWSEATLTWQHQPGGSTPSVKIWRDEMYSGNWNITSVVDALYTRGNTGLELQGNKPNVWFAPNSREYLARYGNRGIPYLLISWN
jgi:hypothetical protein